MEMHHVTVVGSSRCGADVVLLSLSRPDGYSFSAGQWFRMGVDVGGESELRTFSFSSAPSDPTIELATRLSDSSFKQALARLDTGDAVTISAAGGRPTFPSDATHAAFLVGGVGITPVRSTLRAAQAAGHSFDDAVLFYGNRDVLCEPYLGELLGMSNIGLRVVRVLEHPPEGWAGDAGFINAGVVRRELDDPGGRHWLVAGPPVMVEAMTGVLDASGVPVELRHIERFGAVKSGADSR